MTRSPKISVIIPVYNPGQYLKHCLDSIAGQTHRNLEIILIDDGSTDGSGLICDECAAADRRFKVIHQKNAGVSNARNAGLEVASGEYFHFPDSDDYLELDCYEYLLELFETHLCDVVNFEYFVTYPDREKCHQLSDEYYGLADQKRAHEIVWCGEPFACNKLYKAKLITGNKINASNGPSSDPIRFRPDIYRGEDSLFVHTVLERAESVWFDRRALYHYVQSTQSACRGCFKVNQLSAVKLYDAYHNLFKDKYPEIIKALPAWQCSLSIMLYRDMWQDKQPFAEERRLLFEHFKKMLRLAAGMTGKERVKYLLFLISPQLFCVMHKLIHRLEVK